jgi:hypothetical protein
MKGETVHEGVSILPLLHQEEEVMVTYCSLTCRRLLSGDTAFIYSFCAAALTISLSLIKCAFCNLLHYIPGECIHSMSSVLTFVNSTEFSSVTQ